MSMTMKIKLLPIALGDVQPRKINVDVDFGLRVKHDSKHGKYMHFVYCEGTTLHEVRLAHDGQDLNRTEGWQFVGDAAYEGHYAMAIARVVPSATTELRNQINSVPAQPTAAQPAAAESTSSAKLDNLLATL